MIWPFKKKQPEVVEIDMDVFLGELSEAVSSALTTVAEHQKEYCEMLLALLVDDGLAKEIATLNLSKLDIHIRVLQAMQDARMRRAH